MFNLIITIIAIALVVVLTATSIYYGGSAFNSGSADALAATFINQAQQVQAGATLFEAQNGGAPTSVAELISGNFLKSNPKTPTGEGWNLDSGYAVAESALGTASGETTITAEVCNKINEDGSDVVRCLVADDVAAAVALLDAEGTTPIPAVTATTGDLQVVIKL